MTSDQTAVTEVILAADHAGFAHKSAVREWLAAEGFRVVDVGAYVYDEADDFPAFMAAAARNVQESPSTVRAILFGGSGQGEAMQANRFPGVRATVVYGGPDEIVTLSRSHNDANVLSVGARFVSIDETKRLIWLWLHTAGPTDEKYHRRNQALDHASEIV